MKLYEDDIMPHCRITRVFVAEKGIEIPGEKIDALGGENLKPDYQARSPYCLVPLLQLEDGTYLAESIAICRYIEEMNPTPALMGEGALEKATIEMWSRLADIEGIMPGEDYFRNSAPSFERRGVHGRGDLPQISEMVARGAARLARFYQVLETRLQEHEFLSGSKFTIADIIAMCAVDFAQFNGLPIPEDCPNVRRWFDLVSGRASAKAWPGMKEVAARSTTG
jgi:glutathione S-transferase